MKIKNTVAKKPPNKSIHSTLMAWLHSYAYWITANPWKVLIASLLLALGLSAGMSQLTFRGDNRIFFADTNPDLVALDKFEQVYGRDDTLVFVITAKSGDLFTPTTLHAISTLTDQAWNLPNAKRVDSLTNFQRVQTVNDDINTNTLDDRYVRYFDQSFDFRQATDLLNQELGGFYTLEFSLDSGSDGGISNPQYLEQVEQFANWLREQPGVTHVNGLPDIIKTLNRAMNGGARSQYPQAHSRPPHVNDHEPTTALR